MSHGFTTIHWKPSNSWCNRDTNEIPEPRHFVQLLQKGSRWLQFFWITLVYSCLIGFHKGWQSTVHIIVSYYKVYTTKSNSNIWESGHVKYLHDNAWPHVCCETVGELEYLDLWCCHIHHILPILLLMTMHCLKKLLKGQTLKNNEELQVAVWQWVCSTPKDWFHENIWKLPDFGGKYIEQYNHIHIHGYILHKF